MHKQNSNIITHIFLALSCLSIFSPTINVIWFIIILLPQLRKNKICTYIRHYHHNLGAKMWSYQRPGYRPSYFSCFPKYIMPVKCPDFLLCNSKESFDWKAILHSLHMNCVLAFAPLSFLKEGIFIECQISIIAFKIYSLTLLIQ